MTSFALILGSSPFCMPEAFYAKILTPNTQRAVDHMRLGPGSQGTLINAQPGFRPGGTVNLFSVAVDFVF